MALKYFRHRGTGEVIRSLKKLDEAEWGEVITAPHVKMMEPINRATGKSKMKNQQEILLARSRNHARDVDASDQMRVSIENGMGDVAAKNLLNEKGEKRKKIDDM